MTEKPGDICPRPESLPPTATTPQAAGIYPTSVWQCASPDQALELLRGETDGYVYQRDRHPNADMLSQKLAELHQAEEVAITSSGMSAMAAVTLSQLEQGDHIIVSDQLYGRSLDLLVRQAPRLGVTCDVLDTGHLQQVEDAFGDRTKLLVVETISNPLLRVADLDVLATLAHKYAAKLVVDNTFASPILCRPLEHGADLVVESISKSINGHSDVMLGAVCGRTADWQQVPDMLSIWGLSSSPFDCWLAARGLMTLHLRAEAASANALAVADYLDTQVNSASTVRYPGLTTHPDHELASRQFHGRYGAVVTFDLADGGAAAEAFIKSIAPHIPFAPSLGEVSTTLSHPASTSHRNLTPSEQTALGITNGTIRLSIGTESHHWIIDAIQQAVNRI